MAQNDRVLFAMGSSPEENRPAATDRRKADRWNRYFYSLHLAVQESEKLECRHSVFRSETIERGERTKKSFGGSLG